MKWKCLLLALALASGISAGGEAYDMNAVAAASLPKGFTYREAAGTETLHFMEKDIPYQMGQLQYTLEKQQSFSSGYIIRALLPVEVAEALKPYFKMNRDEHVWRRLTQMNRALLNPASPLRKRIEETVLSLARNAIGPVADSSIKVELSSLEPFRRLDVDEAYVYTVGGLITYNAEGMKLPMYCRSYFFPGSEGLDVLMLFTPDEGKAPLLYAIDDLVNAAAKEELNGAAGYKDLGVVLGKNQ